MGTPSKSQVLKWNLQPFADVAADADKITSAIDDRAPKSTPKAGIRAGCSSFPLISGT
ncbi:hypothetical protein GPX89_03785 [Nocardia sp. ET3-3]|uniref:Uncharacterized protein n=1 Tax=Nocardia terrae TaxID=2675851 RepID=A0A7K1UPT9_9NOCA|nr:hypothetical protein [Nocardia terrae]MVU76363.1 hypothetical protein [Nocardia terrae]